MTQNLSQVFPDSKFKVALCVEDCGKCNKIVVNVIRLW